MKAAILRARLPVFWLALLVFPLALHGQIEVNPPEPVEHKLVRVKLPPGTKAGVINTEFLPVDMERVNSEYLVFTGKPGKYLIMGFDQEGNFVQHPVVIKPDGGPDPGPDPPGPDPPGPDPPNPPDIPNRFGYGFRAYQTASTIGDKAGAKKLAAIWTAAANKLLNGEVDEQGAIDYIFNQSHAQLQNIAQWKTWGEDMTRLFDEKAKEQKLKTPVDYVRAIGEVGAALKVYGG